MGDLHKVETLSDSNSEDRPLDREPTSGLMPRPGHLQDTSSVPCSGLPAHPFARTMQKTVYRKLLSTPNRMLLSHGENERWVKGRKVPAEMIGSSRGG